MKKIEVKICMGTTCYVMGASNLQNLTEELSPALRALVDVRGSTCLDLCKGGGLGKAPFVEINGEVLSGATLASVIKRIEEIAEV